MLSNCLVLGVEPAYPLPVAFAMVKCATENDIERCIFRYICKMRSSQHLFHILHIAHARTSLLSRSVGRCNAHTAQSRRVSCNMKVGEILQWHKECFIAARAVRAGCQAKCTHTRDQHNFCAAANASERMGKTGFCFAKIAFSCEFLMVRRQVHHD